MRPFAFFALAVAVALGGTASAQAPAAPVPSPSPALDPAEGPSFPAQVEQVTVDVVVTDKKGNPVTGLTRDDFVVEEEGEPQGVVSFDAVTVPVAPSLVTPERPRISTNLEREDRTGRTFVVLFDDMHLNPMQAQRAKNAVAQFLRNGVREGDRVTLVASSGSAWWSTRMEAGRDELIAMLKRLDGRHIPDMSPERMSDYEAMRIHVYHDTQVEGRVSRRFETYGVAARNASQYNSDLYSDGDPFVRARASDVYFQAVSRNRITLQVLERVLLSLASSKGRKSLMLVSEGFIYDPNLNEFKAVVQASRRANTAIYFLDTRGLQGPTFLSAEFGPPIDNQDIGAALMDTLQEAEGSESLAADTGGFTVKNTNDLSRGIERIADETRAYYLLGYAPKNTARDGRFRKIEVKLPGKKGLRIRARRGYFAPLEGGQPLTADRKGSDPDIQAALDSPYDVQEIPLRMTAFVFDETLMGKASALVATDVDVREFAFQEDEGRFVDSLEFLLVVAHRETGEFFRYDQKIEMRLQPSTKERLSNTWFPVVRDFELSPGGYQAKIVVRDKNSGRIGTVVHEFEVPDLSAFRVSTPLISDALQADQDQKVVPRPTMVVRRTFAPGSTLFASFEVYGAAKDKASAMPQVSAGYTVRKPSGEAILDVPASRITPTSLGKLTRMFGQPLPPEATGDLELVLHVTDEITGKTLQVTEKFTVAPDAVASAGN